MKVLERLRFQVSRVFRHTQGFELDEELLSHIQHRADDLERSGMDRSEAERRARVEFGGIEKYSEDSYRAQGGNFFGILAGDFRFSVRVLRKSPGFTTVAVLTLALAIGANAVVFGVLNALVLRPLDLPDEQSLYSIERGENGFISYPDYVDMRDRNRSFDTLAAVNINQVALNTGKEPSQVWVYETSGNYFEALRIRPYLGRLFQSSDEHGANSVPYIVLGYDYWHTHFHDDPAVIGRTVQINKRPFTIIGVTPSGFRGTLMFMSPELFVPMVNHDELSGNDDLNSRSRHWVFQSFGHLKPGFTPAQATADLNSIGEWLQANYPKEEPSWKFGVARPELYGNYLGNPIRGFVAGLMLLAFLILLAACANLGSLFAARAADRSREVALRLALGSSRSRVLRQLLTEAVLISLLGGMAGLLASLVLLKRLSTWQPFPRFPLHVPVHPDANVYGVALLLALLSGLLFGMVPVRQVLRTDPYEVVKAGSLTAAGRRVTVRDLLLAGQIAICAVLVTSSFVALRGLVRSLHSDFGFDPRDVVIGHMELGMAGYRGEMITSMQRRTLDAMETIPGVKAVAIANELPLDMNATGMAVFTDKTTDLKPANAIAHPWTYKVSPRYFEATGTSLLAGRTFTWHDDKDSPRVAVVNREFAQKVYGSIEDAVGHYFKLRDGSLLQVAGVVEDGKYFNIAEDAKPAVFFPLLQMPPESQTWLVVRSGGDQQHIASAIRAKVRELDGSLPVYIQPWEKQLDDALFPSRIATLALGVLGTMGAVLSITGIFGMAAYSVSKRMRELGIRIALGARRQEVLRAALGRAFKLLAFGSAAGLVLGLMATKVLAFIVYQATPRDPLVLTGVVVAMALLGLLATWIPAQRALSVDPLILLRDQ